jgi:hypothetical protein
MDEQEYDDKVKNEGTFHTSKERIEPFEKKSGGVGTGREGEVTPEQKRQAQKRSFQTKAQNIMQRRKDIAAEEEGEVQEGEYRHADEHNREGQFALGMEELLSILDEVQDKGNLTDRQKEEILASAKAKAEVASGERDHLPGAMTAEEDKCKCDDDDNDDNDDDNDDDNGEEK